MNLKCRNEYYIKIQMYTVRKIYSATINGMQCNTQPKGLLKSSFTSNIFVYLLSERIAKLNFLFFHILFHNGVHRRIRIKLDSEKNIEEFS